MAQCTHCGVQIQEGAAVCPSCSNPAAAKKKSNVVLISVLVGCGCLMLVALAGVISAILVPNLLDALEKAKQKRTIADMRNTGTALMSWLTDQGGEDADRAQDIPENPSAAELEALLVPTYIQTVPATDGWGHELEVRINPDLLASRVFRIRSPGRDGIFEAESYGEPEPFTPTDYDRDIVWVDGYFVRWPEAGR
ncbi:MAG: hypothetical protein GY856_41050 [bacterium]|nr:hypothetical protein [bacterium]